jgi:hypothetical protein
MFMIYWSEVHEDGLEAKSRVFDTVLLAEPLEFQAALRREGEETGKIRFVTMVSENPNSVGKAGATSAGADYDWSKQHRAGAKPSRGDLSHCKDH